MSEYTDNTSVDTDTGNTTESYSGDSSECFEVASMDDTLNEANTDVTSAYGSEDAAGTEALDAGSGDNLTPEIGSFEPIYFSLETEGNEEMVDENPETEYSVETAADNVEAEEPGSAYPLDQAQWWQRGVDAIETNLDAMRDDYHDKGFEDGNELDALLGQDRRAMYEELGSGFREAENASSDVCPPDGTTEAETDEQNAITDREDPTLSNTMMPDLSTVTEEATPAPVSDASGLETPDETASPTDNQPRICEGINRDIQPDLQLSVLAADANASPCDAAADAQAADDAKPLETDAIASLADTVYTAAEQLDLTQTSTEDDDQTAAGDSHHEEGVLFEDILAETSGASLLDSTEPSGRVDADLAPPTADDELYDNDRAMTVLADASESLWEPTDHSIAADGPQEAVEISPVYEEEAYELDGIDIMSNPERLNTSLRDFSDDEWQDRSDDKRHESIQELVYCIQDQIGLINPPDIEYYNNPDPADYGAYQRGTNTLCINEYTLDDNAEAADTVAHELWHAYQYQCAKNPRTGAAGTVDWQRNYGLAAEHYVKPINDQTGHCINFDEYSSQFIEAEAREFAQRVKDQLHRQ